MCFLTEKEKSRQLLAEASAYPKLIPFKGFSKKIKCRKIKTLKTVNL